MSADVGPRVGVPQQGAGPAQEPDRRVHAAPRRRSWTDRTPFVLEREVYRGDPALAAARRRSAWTTPLLRRAVLGDALVAAVVSGVSLVTLRDIGVDLTPLAVAVLAAGCAGVWVGVLAALRGYEWRRVGDGPDEFSSILRAAVAVVAALGVAAFSLQLLMPRRMVLVVVPLVAVLTALHRHHLRGWLRRQRREGPAALRTLVVGDGASARDVVDDLRRAPDHGMHVVGVAVPLPHEWEVDEEGYPACLGAVAEVPQTVVDHDVDAVIVVGSHLSGPALRRLSWALEPTGADLVVAPGLVEVTGPSVHLRPAAGLSLLHVERPSSRTGRLLGKAALDRTLGTALLLAASPVLLAAALSVKLSSRGPAFFAQQRVGVDGALFTMYKLRTMVVGADRMVDQLAAQSDRDGLMFKMRSDPRVTPVGRWLRRFSLDELPQLWNVVRGDMSLVGPRPPLPREYVEYHDSVHLRLRVRPGLTGLWQVSGRADLSWEESMRLDLRYVDNWSLAMDAMILWKTARAVLRRSGAY
ncbi:sugar transferase [uncultured Pseudokineococcus sp.]|uniref:sugar transferase n=1 Tax=uncultured Pseudokineococcus sp. TaxID=1642928 RepID=UPI002607437F|nr:sugar transferase [uncultured Pseudokineococcus sp.]